MTPGRPMSARRTDGLTSDGHRRRRDDRPRTPRTAPMPPRTDATHPNRAAFPAGLSGPALRALAVAGVRSLDDLAAWSESELLALHGMGAKGVRTLGDALRASGRAFRPR